MRRELFCKYTQLVAGTEKGLDSAWTLWSKGSAMANRRIEGHPEFHFSFLQPQSKEMKDGGSTGYLKASGSGENYQLQLFVYLNFKVTLHLLLSSCW
jgi:hypothetical protein